MSSFNLVLKKKKKYLYIDCRASVLNLFSDTMNLRHIPKNKPVF